MNKQDNIAIVRRYFDEVWNKGNLDAADDLVAPDFSVEGCSGAISGLEAVKLYVSSYRTLYARIHFTLLSLTAEGDRVIACWVTRSLPTTACSGEPRARAKCTTTTGLSVYRIAGGKIAEAWAGSEHDGRGNIRRLGIRREDIG